MTNVRRPVMDLRPHRINSLSDFDKNHNFKFVVMTEEQGSAMGADYGPPDPPPQMEYFTVIKLLAFETQEQVVEWIKYHTEGRFSKPEPYKIFKVEGVSVTTEVKINLG